MTYHQDTLEYIEDEMIILPYPPTRKFITRSWRNRSGKNRPARLWTEANEGNDRLKIYIIFWVASLLKYEVDHIVPQSQGGSYHHSNLRLVPKSVNRMMSDNGWDHQVLNDVIAGMNSFTKEMLGIPEGFRSMDAWTLVLSHDWIAWIDT